MAMRKINARDIIVQVRASDGTTWIGVGGLNNVTPNRSENEETVDTTVNESGGRYEQEVMQRGFSITLAGFELKDHLTGALDPGQARITELADQVGYNSLGAIRLRHPMESLWTVWNEATFALAETGGGHNDKSAWGATITRSGPSTTAAVV